MTASKTKAKASSKAAAAGAFDPRSEAVVLAYQGTDEGVPHLLGIPARDLTHADITRLVYADQVRSYDGTPGSPAHPNPEQPDQKACAALVELLLSRKVDGKAVYKAVYAIATAEPATVPIEPPTPADTPAQPEA
jgi:hypothetical protein